MLRQIIGNLSFLKGFLADFSLNEPGIFFEKFSLLS
jgi:hypothetical protein